MKYYVQTGESESVLNNKSGCLVRQSVPTHHHCLMVLTISEFDQTEKKATVVIRESKKKIEVLFLSAQQQQKRMFSVHT